MSQSGSLFAEFAVWVQCSKASQCPDGEDIAITCVANGTSLVKYTNYVALQEQQKLKHVIFSDRSTEANRITDLLKGVLHLLPQN